MKNLNSVCFISKVLNISPIKGADNIELVNVRGWNCISQKGIHNIGDLVLTITTDAVIPEELAVQWEVKNYLRSGNRVKTINLKGTYSECLIVSLQFLDIKKVFKEDECLQKLLNIYKYEPPVESFYPVKGSINPYFVKHYKFPNSKNVKNIFREESQTHLGDEVIITRKIKGVGARYGIILKAKITWKDKLKKFFGCKWAYYEFVFGSSKLQRTDENNIWYRIAFKYNIRWNLWNFVKTYFNPPIDLGRGIVIFGEIHKDCSNGSKFSGFDVWFNGEYLDTYSSQSVIKELNLSFVPILYEGVYSKEIEDSFVENNYIENTLIPHEGIVVSCPSGDRNKIYKVINPEYLIYSELNNILESY